MVGKAECTGVCYQVIIITLPEHKPLSQAVNPLIDRL